MTYEKKPGGRRRVVVYVESDDYKKLKSKLALAGQSVSGWFREVTKRFVKR